MIQINLLPDVKLEFIRMRRMRRLVIMIGIVVVSVSIIITSLVTFNFYSVKQATIKTQGKQIEDAIGAIRTEENLQKILTAKQSIATLNEIHKEKWVAGNTIFYINDILLDEVGLDGYSFDFNANTFSLSLRLVDGADSDEVPYQQERVFESAFYVEGNKEVESIGEAKQRENRVFSKIICNGCGIGQDTQDFTISGDFIPKIFANDEDRNRSPREKNANTYHLYYPKTITYSTSRDLAPEPADNQEEATQPEESS